MKRLMTKILDELKNDREKGITFVKSENEETKLSYTEIYIKAMQALAFLQSNGVKPGMEAIFQMETEEDFIIMCWGCILGGIIPVPLNRAVNFEQNMHLFRVWDILEKPFFLGTHRTLKRLFDFGKSKLNSEELNEIKAKSIYYDDSKRDLSVFPVLHEPEPEDIVTLLFSSGSTGEPKAVMITHRNLMTNINSLNERWKIDGEKDSSLSWMPLTHVVGFILSHFASNAAHINQVIMPPSLFISKPELWIKKADEYQSSILSTPNFGMKLLNTEMENKLENTYDLSNVRIICDIGEPISFEVCNRFLDILKKQNLNRNSIIPCFGMTEATIGITAGEVGEPLKSVCIDRRNMQIGEKIISIEDNNIHAVTFVDLGSPFSCCEVRITGADNQVLEEERIGYVQIKGGAVTQGYYKNPEATRSAVTNDGWFITGDLGFLLHNRLIVTGRVKNIIFINGQNFYPHDIERIAEKAKGVDGRTIAVTVLKQDSKDEKVGVFVEYSDELEDFIPKRRNIKEEINEKMGLDVYDVVPVIDIPKTGSGKIKRYQLSQMYDTGSFNSVIHTIKTISTNRNSANANGNFDSETKAEKKIREIFEFVLGKHGLNPLISIFQYGMNSVSMMKIADRLQREFLVTIDINDLFECKTIRELANKIEKKEYFREERRYPSKNADVEHKYDPFPLTEIQTAYLLGRNENYDLGGISTHVYIELKTRLDIKRFNRAFTKVIKKHDMMRTVFKNDTQRILQNTSEYKIQVLDLSHLDCEAFQSVVLNERNKMSHAVFQPEQWPLFEVKAIKNQEGEYFLLIGLDMLIIDALSLEIIAEDLSKYYENEELELEEMDFTFRDYIMAYKELKSSKVYETDKAYWLEKLDNFPPAPKLPLAARVSDIKDIKYERVQRIVNRETREKLKCIARKHRVTESAILCTAFLEVLSIWSNQPQLAINLTVINRYPFHRDVDRLVGDFTSVLPLGVNFKYRTGFWDKVEDVQKTMMEGIKHRHYDGVEFVRELAKAGRYQGEAIIPVVFTSALTNEMWGKWNRLGEINYIITQTSQVYLDYQASEVEGGLLLNWDYIADLFDQKMIRHMFEQYIQLVISLCEGKTIHQINLLPEDREAILKYNSTYEEIKPSLLHGLFEEQVRLRPDHIAVIDGECSITYRELNQKANRIARKLKETGFEGNFLVGVYTLRCMESVACIMGILKAGGAYVPIDPSYPQDRIDYILENSGCSVMIKPDFYEHGQLESYGVQNLNMDGKPTDNAYIIYTSGSTGIPKGVVITHKSAANTIIDINKKFHVGEEDRILGISSMCFDLSVFDIFGSFAAGAALVMIPDQRDINYMKKMIQKYKITIWNSVPAIMDMMIQHMQEELEIHKERGFELERTENDKNLYETYYWSPAFDNEELGEYELIKPENLQLFPEFYLFAIKGATLEKIFEKYKKVPKEELKVFLNRLIEDKVLVNTINNPYEIFQTQEKLFDNHYSENIKYNPDLYEKFKEKQLNRNYKFASGKIISLMNQKKYPDYLENRYSHRKFDESRAISFSHFSYLLSVCSQRVKYNKVQYYYPSAGGLYPIDLYLYVKRGRVEGVKEGIYYYNPVYNSIALVNDTLQITDDIQFYNNKAIFQSSAVTIYFVYNAQATMPKYGGAGCFYACIDTGIIAATLTGVAERLNLGTCSIGEINMDGIENWFLWSKNQKLLHSMEIGIKENIPNNVDHEEEEEGFAQLDHTGQAEESGLSSLRLIMLSGDWIPLNLPMKIRKLYKNARVISLGGATEASIWSIYYPIEEQRPEWKSIPYGFPLANQQIYILNYKGELCHRNTPGEIYIGGVGLAEGYKNDEEKTRKAFIHHPEFGRLYKTGDFGVMVSEGYVEFLGRKDQQIKIRGYRIELGEIEHQLNSHEKILNAAVIDFDDKDRKKYLCAYVVSNEKIDSGELKEYLKTKLPEYMVPSYILQIQSIPWSSNGKVNKKALPPPQTFQMEKEIIGPGNETEKIIMGFWKEVLKTDEISITDNFFDIGGDSMLLLKVYSKIDRRFPKYMKITDLFSRTSILKIAEFLNQKQKPDRKIELNAIKLPPGYYQESGIKYPDQKLSFTMDRSIEEKLRLIAKNENVSLEQLLSALYIYTLHQISGIESIEVQVLLEKKNEVHSLKMNFRELETFEELFRKMKGGSKQNDYQIEDLKKVYIKRDKEGIVPLFVVKDALTEKLNLLDYYDFIITVDYHDRGLYFECEYNSKLKAAKAKEIVTDYSNLLNAFIKKYGQEQRKE